MGHLYHGELLVITRGYITTAVKGMPPRPGQRQPVGDNQRHARQHGHRGDRQKDGAEEGTDQGAAWHGLDILQR